METYIALTAKGLGDVLSSELREQGVDVQENNASEVIFKTDIMGIYRVHLESRIASRFIKPLSRFYAKNPDEVYSNIQKLDFTKYIEPNGKMYVDASIRECLIRDQRLLAMKVKDAVADQFRDKFNIRPDVDKMEAQLRIQIRGVRDRYDVSLDMTGESLFKRGYRKQVGEAPIKENLAAGLLAIAEWDGCSNLVDPMCGSGTFLIEAALKALRVGPGTLRNRFIFMEHKKFNEEKYQKILDEVLEKELDEVDCELYGFDRDRKALRHAIANVKAAGVASLIEIKRGDVTTLEAPCKKGIVVTNPPYAIRMGEEENLKDVYRDLGFTLKTHFKGWTVWVLAGNKDLTPLLSMKTARKYPVKNGGVDCRFLKYEIHQ